MLKQTPLHQLHLDLGGKMTAFAGYQLPIHYSHGIIREHLHCRNQTGFFDISHMGQGLIIGDEAAVELDRLTPSDIAGLKPGQQKYTVLTNKYGGIIDDIIVARIESGVKIVVNAACKDKDFQFIASKLSNRCQFVELKDQALIALQGPFAESIIKKFSAQAAALPFMAASETTLDNIKCTISRCGYTGEDGFEISVANQHAKALAKLLLAENDVIPIGLGARDTLRLEAGLCLYGHELNESVTPIEAGLAWMVKMGKNTFPGADKIVRQLQHDTEKKRVGLIVDSRQPVRENNAVYNDNGEIVGHVTSGSYAPSMGKPVAMAFLDARYCETDCRLTAKVRDQLIPLTVAALPFIPHRYKR